ncbi:MAG: cupredoxin domain-containing protein [Acidimicrobiia bacterium]
MSVLRRSSFISVALVVIALGALVPAGPAGADEHQMAAFFIEYLPRSVDTNQGDTLVFANTDPFSGPGHTVTHDAAPGETPKFDSGVVPFGSTMEIPGVAELAPGDYLITCRTHPIMRGYLSVGGPPRPITDAIIDFLT